MQDGFGRAKVRLTGQEMQKFLRRMQSDAEFSKKCRAALHTGDEKKIAQFLKRHGFKLG
ncbi:MAG: hypothetical protein K6T81_09665 [Alicyclobacillus macrosporangiidus]|uniref:hypothetical protein n=1 Tax=Alicyclobacillus macrosporangiidus TaxID=392015 RepID=UPI0026F0E44F|nr:hypothetical protein [Alicyclobacillus macrosporangiidus]MCL6598998.1 hypothetical protein [Alicyclobacillus macrosporangiidus]